MVSKLLVATPTLSGAASIGILDVLPGDDKGTLILKLVIGVVSLLTSWISQRKLSKHLEQQKQADKTKKEEE